MAPLTVDPETLAGAGGSIGCVGDDLAVAMNTLAAGLGAVIPTGVDAAGLAFGISYQKSARALLDAGAAAVDACRSLGFGVLTSATNYSRADVSSTIGGCESPLTPPVAPGEFSAPASPSPSVGGVPPPVMWSTIEMFIPDVWPDGNADVVKSSADAWDTAASVIDRIAGELAAPSGTIAGQQIPEGGAVTSAISELAQAVSQIASESQNLGTQTREFANDVEKTQSAIRDLMDRLSPSGFLDTLESIFGGDAWEELKEVAEDVRVVLGEFGRQTEGRSQLLQQSIEWMDSSVMSLQHWARKEFTQYLGDDVGSLAASAFEWQTNVGEGFVKAGLESVQGIQTLDPTLFAYDPEGAKATWGALADTAMYAIPTYALMNPGGTLQHGKDMLSGLVHAEDWRADRPGLGFGAVGFEVASSVTGLGTSKTATHAVEEAAEGVAVRQMTVSAAEVSEVGRNAGRISEVLDDLVDDVPTRVMPEPDGSAVPQALVHPEVPAAHKVPEPESASPMAEPPSHNPPHTGLYDPPLNVGVPGEALPDLTEINDKYRSSDGAVPQGRLEEWSQEVSDACPGISPEGVQGVYDYTDENYGGINNYLRGTGGLDPNQLEVFEAESITEMKPVQDPAWEAQISALDDGVASLPPYRQDPMDTSSLTWRGMEASDSLLERLQVGHTFSDPGFLSTTADRSVAETFAYTVDTETTPTLLTVIGHDGVDVSQLSRYAEESEVLFPRSSRFEVLSREVGSDGLVYIVLRQITP